jgi:site-specific recombinase XerD
MPKTYPTIKIVQRSKDNLDGNRNIFIRITINRISKYIPLNIYTKAIHFKKGIVSKADPDYQDKNSLIEYYSLKAKKIIFDCRIADKLITFSSFQNDFLNSSYQNETFPDFFEKQVDLMKSRLSVNSIKCYNSQLKKLREFRPNLSFEELNTGFIYTFEGFLKSRKENNRNTVIKSLAIVKSICNKAVDQGKLKKNPFNNYPLGRIEGDRKFLTVEELNKLENIYHGNNLKKTLHKVLRYFLFCCYTGLRFQDVRNLRHRHIVSEEHLHLQMGKTKEYITIPLINKAKQLIPEGRFENQTVFKVLSNQPTNRYLKEIISMAVISKQISFHCARHTFATNSLTLGIPIDIVSKVLGHKNLRTTQIYLHYQLDHITN